MNIVDGDAVVCGSMVKHFNTAAGADTLLQPRIVACRTGRRTTFVPPLARFIINASTMSGILRKRPPSTGGTPTEPSSCKTSFPPSGLSNPLTTNSQETAVRRCRQGATRHREGILRCVSTPQVVSRRHQRPDQALRRTSISNNYQLR